MNDDLVTRLRAFNDAACGGAVGVVTEAANEIERLRSIIAQISDVLQISVVVLKAAKL